MLVYLQCHKEKGLSQYSLAKDVNWQTRLSLGYPCIIRLFRISLGLI